MESKSFGSDNTIPTETIKAPEDRSLLNREDLARDTVALMQEFTNSTNTNGDHMNILGERFKRIQEKYEALEKNGLLSEKTQKLMTSLQESIVILKGILIERNKSEPDYKPLQYQLTEHQVDMAVKRMNEILGSESPTIIITGNGKYKQSGAPDLKGSINDVYAVAEKLSNEHSGSDSKILTNENATKNGILDVIKNSPPDKPVFFYFSGHGYDGHILPYSTESFGSKKSPNFNEMISPEELFAAIGDRQAMIIVDQCYGGNLALKAPKNITVVSSTDPFTQAQEGQVDQIKSDSNAIQNGEKSILYSHDTVTIPGVGGGTVRSVASFGLTENGKNLNIPGFVGMSRKQNPVIKTR